MKINKKIFFVVLVGIILFGGFGGAKAANLFAEETATIQVIKNVIPSTVSIGIYQDLSQDASTTGTMKKKIEVGQGTGFIIQSDGFIITNRHVISKEGEYKVFLSNGRAYSAQVLVIDQTNDLALMKIEAKNLPVAKLGNSDALQVGQTVLAIGNALGRYQNSVTKGIVSGLSRSLEASYSGGGGLEKLEDVVQTDAAINLGNSGGPLVNLRGEIIGVNVALESNAQSIGFAIPINDARKVIDSYKKYGAIKKAFLGVRYEMIDAQVKEEYGLIQDAGAFVISGDTPETVAVLPDSAANQAGLLEGDVIVSINNILLNKVNSLRRVILRFWPGDKVTVKISRNNQIITRTAQLQEYPQEQ